MNGFDFSSIPARGAVPASAPVVAARLGSDGFVFDRAESFGSVTGAGVEGINAHGGTIDAGRGRDPVRIRSSAGTLSLCNAGRYPLCGLPPLHASRVAPRTRAPVAPGARRVIYLAARVVAGAWHPEGVHGVDVNNRSPDWRLEIAQQPCAFQLAPALVSKCGTGNNCNC